MDGREIIDKYRLLEDRKDSRIALLRAWIERTGIATHCDSAGNVYASQGEGPRLLIGSEGALGALVGLTLLERQPARAMEIAAFVNVAEAAPGPAVRAYCAIELDRGRLLECLGVPLGVVEAIAGVSRWEVRFEGQPGHAGATPMNARHDALACAAEWIGLMEHIAETTPGLVATAGAITVLPAGGDGIPHLCTVSLDVRHALDEVRKRATNVILDGAEHIAHRRGLTVTGEACLERAAVALSGEILDEAVQAAGLPLRRLVNGAGHPLPSAPTSMLLLRSVDDIEAALQVGDRLLRVWRPA